MSRGPKSSQPLLAEGAGTRKEDTVSQQRGPVRLKEVLNERAPGFRSAYVDNGPGDRSGDKRGSASGTGSDKRRRALASTLDCGKEVRIAHGDIGGTSVFQRPGNKDLAGGRVCPLTE